MNIFLDDFFFFWPRRHAACGILVPRPGIEPAPPALEAQSLNHWTAREVPRWLFFFFLADIHFSFLFIYIWLCWVFVSVRGLSPVAASGGHSSSRCTGFSPSRPLPLRSTGSRRAGSVVVAHRPSRSAACGIFPDQGWNPCALHLQADSQPLRHQASPLDDFLFSDRRQSSLVEKLLGRWFTTVEFFREALLLGSWGEAFRKQQ